MALYRVTFMPPVDVWTSPLRERGIVISPDEQATVRPNQDRRKMPSPPYISFVTFTNFLDWIEKEGVPLRFDRSFWQSKFSGSTGTQLMSGLRFLGLLERDNPTPDLDNVIKAKNEERRAALKRIVQGAYSTVNFDELSRATPAMVTEWFQSYHLEGHTLRKAESFFIKACKYAGIPLSTALRKKARSNPSQSGLSLGGHGKRTRPRTKAFARKARGEEADTLDVASNEDASHERHFSETRIELASGGEIVLGVTANLFVLSRTDREFLFKLVDLMNSYRDTELPGNDGT